MTKAVGHRLHSLASGVVRVAGKRHRAKRQFLVKITHTIMASIFSRIIAGEIPCYKVAENERFFAFLDIAPLAKGHTLVVPKREVEYFYDLEDDELEGMIVFAKQIAKKIQATTQCRKVATVVLGLEVAHAHIHLIPMNSEKDVDFGREKLSLTAEEFTEIAKSLQ